MAWLDGSAEQEIEVSAPLDEVAAFFAHPDRFEHCIDDLEDLEEVDDGVWHFQLEELSAKGISFQGEYYVEYTRDGDVVFWEPADGREGNMRSEGRVQLTDLGDDRTRVEYEQKMSVELPIPSLMTGAFRPIVNREVRKAIETMLDCAKETLDEGA